MDDVDKEVSGKWKLLDSKDVTKKLSYRVTYYRTTQNVATRETPFTLTFRVNTVIPIKIGILFHIIAYFSENENISLVA